MSGNPSGNTRMTILIVDDNSDYLFLLETILTLEGYAVLAAADGVVALEILKREVVHMIISDIQMPAMDGVALHKHVRSLPAHARTPFIFISGYADAYSRSVPIVPGRDHFLDKSVPCEEMLECVRSLFAAPGTNDDTRVHHSHRT
jgi:CheY-like chemotaxis protein